MRIIILGGGPAGLYCALLVKKADPARDVTILERNPPDVTYGWGVVFSDRTLASFQRADYKTYTQITEQFVIWDAIDVRYKGEVIRCGGHVIAAIERRRLLDILQKRCAELGVELRFGVAVGDPAELPECDLLVAADGLNSIVRRTYEDVFKPSVEVGKAKYIWLGANKVLDAFNFIFHENEHGLFQVHAYPFNGAAGTFIVECEESTWLRAGLDKAGEEESLAYCQRLLDDDLHGIPLLSNNSKWISFPTLKTKKWHADIRNEKSEMRNQKIVLLGDAAHTAHFSIGSGTKLAMEDAIALAGALEQHSDIEATLDAYELERKPVVETFQRAAHESQTYFETIKRYLALPPMQFAFQLLTRSGRITYDDLHFRDVRFGDRVDSWFNWNAECGVRSAEWSTTKDEGQKTKDERQVATDDSAFRIAPPPMFAPLCLRALTLSNRVVTQLSTTSDAIDDTPYSALSTQHSALSTGSGLALTQICAVSQEGRITPFDCGMYTEEHKTAWASFVEDVRAQSPAKVGIQLGHAGRRGATEPRTHGLDRPLRAGRWPLLSASALPYTPVSRVPKAMDRQAMDRVRDEFVRAAYMADEVGFDLLQLHFGHGYLLASFLSPLTNLREDEYGGSLDNRARYPLEVFDAVRAVWPEGKPLAVAFSATDYVKGGFEIKDGVAFARMLREHECDIVMALGGQTTPGSEPPYGRGFLTPLSDRVRNEAGMATMVSGYLTTSNDVNTILAAGRADLCVMSDELRMTNYSY